MNMQLYFEKNEGVGILSTADLNGEVNAAVYSKPHFLGNGYLSFIAHDKLTRNNLLSSPKANYLFLERTEGFKGVRIYMEKVEEVQDDRLIESLSKRTKKRTEESTSPRFLISFRVKKVLNLVGDTKLPVDFE